ncbi:MAG: class I SAM-dependent methyltransferase [Haliangiales bacterium]
MDRVFVELLRCVSCQSPLRFANRRLACTRCEFTSAAGGPFFDFLGATTTYAPASTEQALMESELVARVYERFWRPAFVRVVAGKGASGHAGGFPGELFVHKNCLAMEDRDGPWLDLSCGPGLFTRAMAASVPGEVVIGLDISAAMLDAAARRGQGYSNVCLVRADAHAIPLRDGCMGGINNSGALHIYDDLEQVFSEIWRVLRPGGVYVGSTFARARTITGRLASRVAGIRRFDPHELRAWLSRIGFADYDEMRLGDSFIFRVRKP